MIDLLKTCFYNGYLT